MPKNFEYLWEWYIEVSSDAETMPNGALLPIKYTSWKAWLEMEGHKINDFEFRILKQIDSRYVQEVNREIENMQARLRESNNGGYSGTRNKGRQPRRKAGR